MRWLAALLAHLFAAAVPGSLVVARESAAVAEQAQEPAEERILVMLKMPAPHRRPNARYSGSYDDTAAQAARRRVAAGIAEENGLELLDGWPMPLIGVDCYVMKVPNGTSLDAVIAQVSQPGIVAWAQPLQTYHALASSAQPDDPLFLAQPSASQWRLAELHGVATGEGVKIALVDSKVELGHPDFAGQSISSRDFVSDSGSEPESHGTGVAGVIAAGRNNGVGIVGIAPGARLLALRACSEVRKGASHVASCDTLSLARALQYAIERHAEIINMSLSGPPDRLLSSLIALGISRGAAVVAAFDPELPDGGFPASASGVIAVTDETLRSVPEPVFRAPGRDIPTTQPGGRWYLANGSSFAAAHVAGLLALAREARGATLRPSSIARAPTGFVDACATLVRVSRGCNCTCALSRAALARRD